MEEKYTFDEKIQLIDTMLHISRNIKTAVLSHENETYIFTAYKPANSNEMSINRTKMGGTVNLSGLEKEIKKCLLPSVAQNTAYQLQGILFCEELDNKQLTSYLVDESKTVQTTEKKLPGIDKVC